MKIASKLPQDANRPYTARNWAVRGFLVNEDAIGEEMYINGTRQIKAMYYSPDEVHKATEAELAAYWQPIKDAKNSADRAKRAKKRAEIAAKVAPLQNYLDKHPKPEDPLTKAICQAVKHAIREYKRFCCSIPLFSFFNPVLPKLPKLEIIESDEIVIDTETTGLNPDEGAEILQLSIINGAGETLYNQYFKPLFAESWNDAMAVNGITPEMVTDAPCIYEELPKIKAILYGAKRIIGYNTQFDLRMLDAAKISTPYGTEIVDVMLDFAPIFGAYHEFFGSYVWQKLTTCAEYYGYDWGEDAAHDSLADCRATLFCYRKMQELPFIKRVGEENVFYE